MFLKRLRQWGVPVLTLATTLLIVGPGTAAGRGGSGGGGRSMGGGGRSGGYGGYSRGGYYGGYRGYGSYSYRSYYGNRFYGGYGGLYLDFYFPSGNYGYGGYPYADLPPAPNGPDYYDPNGGPPPAAPPDYPESYPSPNDGPAARNAASAPVQVTVRVPAGSQVWFNGRKTASTGTVRQFESPALPSGRPFTYEVRAQWTQDGREVSQTRKVNVFAGDRVTVSFPAP